MAGLIRLRLRVSPAITNAAVAGGDPSLTPQKRVESVVASLLVKYGVLRDVDLVTEDPTDDDAFTVLGTRGSSTAAEHDGISILHGEPVDPPPPPVHANAPTLDPDLMQDEARAVALALIKDVDPDRLEGMGDGFAPDLPCVGALLLTKARLENARRRGGQDARDAEKDHRAQVADQGGKPTLGRKGLGSRGGGAPLALSSQPVQAIVGELRRATLDLGPAAASSWDRLAGAVAVALEEDPSGRSPTEEATDAELSTADPSEVSRALGQILGDPHGAALPPPVIASYVGVSPLATKIACSVVRKLGGGVMLVDPVRWRRVKALMPQRPPSNAATQLAGSTVRPMSQNTSDPSSVGPAYHTAKSYSRATSTQLDRGKRAVSRRLWVEWWRAAEMAGMLGAVR